MIEVVMNSGQREYAEMEALHGTFIRFYNTEQDSICMVQIPDYILGRNFAIQQKWITTTGQRYAITSIGQEAAAENKKGTYKSPAIFSETSFLDQWKSRAARNPVIAFLILCFIVVSATVALANGGLDLLTKLSHLGNNPVVKRPLDVDVALRLVYPKSPALIIANSSQEIAREIKFAFAIWNLNSPAPTQPLPIPIATFDWIPPRAEGGPETIFLPSMNIHHGDHLIGSMSVICPNCKRGKTYVVSINWGEGGWYSEVSEQKSGDLIVPKTLNTEGLRKFADFIETQSSHLSRIPIIER